MRTPPFPRTGTGSGWRGEAPPPRVVPTRGMRGHRPHRPSLPGTSGTRRHTPRAFPPSPTKPSRSVGNKKNSPPKPRGKPRAKPEGGAGADRAGVGRRGRRARAALTAVMKPRGRRRTQYGSGGMCQGAAAPCAAAAAPPSRSPWQPRASTAPPPPPPPPSRPPSLTPALPRRRHRLWHRHRRRSARAGSG